MEILNENKDIQGQKVEISYPSSWSYKIIATKQEFIEGAVKDTVGDREYTLVNSKNSKGGKYISMNLDLIVNNEDDRNSIFAKLKKDQNIKMVL